MFLKFLSCFSRFLMTSVCQVSVPACAHRLRPPEAAGLHGEARCANEPPGIGMQYAEGFANGTCADACVTALPRVAVSIVVLSVPFQMGIS